MIQVQSWSRAVAFGSMGVVTFALSSPRPVVEIAVDLLGDGLVAPTIVRGEDLRPVLALGFVAERAGIWQLQVRATDAAGCSDATGVRRDVEVR